MISEIPIEGGLNANSHKEKRKPSEPLKSPPHLFRLPTLHAFIGERGKGKTYNCRLYMAELMAKGYASRIYVIDPTWMSNEVLHSLPVRPEDIYKDDEATDRTFDIIAEVIEKAKEDALFHKVQKEYEKVFQKMEKARKIGKSYQDQEPHDRKFMEMMQEKIAKQYYDLHERMEKWKEENVDIPQYDHEFALQARFPNEEEIQLRSNTTEWDWPVFFPPYEIAKPHPILFLDDLSHTKVYSTSRSNPGVNLALRHRHLGGPGYGISIFYLVQTFKTGIPKALRQNCQQFSLFKGSDQDVLEDIYKEFGGLCTKEDFFRLYFQAVGTEGNSHHFLTVDKLPEDESKAFRRDFDTFLTLPQGSQHQQMQELILGKRKRERTVPQEIEEIPVEEKRTKI